MPQKSVQVTVDFKKPSEPIRPLHAIGQPPLYGSNPRLFSYLTNAGIPYSRLHDVGGRFGANLFVDIPNIFRDFDADEHDPASYDFVFTDKLINNLIAAGCEPYFRLGTTIETDHQLRAYRIFPPKDFAKWARICEHIIRHYNEGWANGFHHRITYWEIWNEPDDCYTDETAAMWKGTPEQFYELYATTAGHLKSCFGDTIKVGGYGHCGVYEFAQDPRFEGLPHADTYIYDFTISFLHGFLKYQQAAGAPLDFFSWHVYDNVHPSTREDFTVIAEHAAYVRGILDHYGYTETEHHLNEWNLFTHLTRRDEPEAAAKALGFMLMMQNTSVDLMCFYDGGVGYSPFRSLFSPETGYPYRTYYALMSFNALYRLKNGVCATSSDAHLFVQAAADGKVGSIVLANCTGDEVQLKLTVEGFSPTVAQVVRIDEQHRYTLTGEALTPTLTMPPHGCLELKLWDTK